ncbi:MAG TPA: hypothetical protein VFQ68_02700, partial [Streptosporangiaceae bacterium]|nr:hypothetical protein [Streptosporangiaceae bacterium]
MSIRPGAARTALLACLLAILAPLLLAPPASAGTGPAGTGPAPRSHVIVVGLSGLRWSDVSATATPALWRLAGQGSAGDLVDYAVLPLTCPADAWLTLNAGARAKTDHTNVTCGAYPQVTAAGQGARVPGLPALESYNQQFHNDPHWGLLAR